MAIFFDYLVTGLVAGAVYALFGSGLVLSYSATGVLNFAQGAFGFVAAIAYFEFNSGLHWPVVPSAVLAIGIIAPLLGWVLHKLMFDRLTRAGETAQLVATIGLLVALPALTLWIVQVMINDLHWNLASPLNQASAPGLGPTPIKYFHPLAGIVINSNQIATFVAAAVVAVLLWLIMTRTRTGLRMRATADRREMAMLRGIDPGRSSAIAWMLSSALAALAGVLAAPVIGLDADSFTLLMLISATAAVYGRFRSIPMTFAAGLGLGVIQNLVAAYSSFAANLTGFSTATPVLLLFVGLLVFNRNRSRVAGSTSEDVPPPDYLKDLPPWRRAAPWAAAIGVLLIYTYTVGTPFWTGVVAEGLALGIVFQSFVIVTGIGGMVSFAQATFVTAAALTTGLLYAHGVSFALAAVAGLAAAVVLGTFFALPALRLGGRILALSTLAGALVADYMLFQLPAINNNSLGWTFPQIAIGPFASWSPRSMVLFLLAVNGLVVLLIRNLTRSASGRSMLAARSAPAAAATAGISIARTKLALFCLSAAVAGLGGILYAVITGQFGSTDAPALTGFLWLAVVVTQGVRRPGGAIVAGLLSTIVPQLFTYVSTSAYIPAVLFGLGGIVLAQQPDGALAQLAEKRYLRRLRRRQREVIAAVEAAEYNAVAAEDTRLYQPELDKAHAASPSLQPSADGSLLTLRGISAGYGEVTVLKDINLVVPQGKVIAVLGANGAGKSTLCKVVTGLLSPTSGELYFDGRPLDGQPPHLLARAGILSVPEARGIFPGLSVDDNIATWLPSRSDRQLVYDRFPVLGQRRNVMAEVLSGGEQQMLSLAPLLVRPPRLAVADEPSLGLAPRIVADIFRLFGELRDKGVTLLLAEEKPTEVLGIADFVVFMSVGQVIWEGLRKDVDDNALMAAYLGIDLNRAPEETKQ